MTTGLRAGAASVALTPATGIEMAGYIARTGPSCGVLDELCCQAVVFDDGQTRLALAVCDLLYMTGPIRSLVCAQLADRLGLAASEVMLAATHTHCGPAHLAAPGYQELQSFLADRICDAVCRAAGTLRPARLFAAQPGVEGISANRRDPAGPADTIAPMIVVSPAESAGPGAIAVLVNFACHATILEHDTCRYSADFPGAMRRTLEDLCGGTAIFLPGCGGDINPVFTEHTEAECARTGAILGAACAYQALAVSRLDRGARVINLSLDTELPVTGFGPGQPVSPAPLRGHLASVPAVVRARPSHQAVVRELATLRGKTASDDPTAQPEARTREAELWIEDLLVRYPQQFDSTDPPAVQPGGPTLPVQVFALGGDLAIVALPGEPFTATGQQIRTAFGGTVLTVGYANNAAGYLPTADEFGRSGYEVGSSQYAPGTAERLAGTAVALLGV